jgi:hypothetical protein
MESSVKIKVDQSFAGGEEFAAAANFARQPITRTGGTTEGEMQWRPHYLHRK